MSLVNDTNKDNLKLYPGYYVISKPTIVSKLKVTSR